MARQITVLEQSSNPQVGTRVLTCVFWYIISPASKQVPKPGFTSKATNLTTQEQADLESGVVREELVSFEFPNSYTTTQMKALINARYTDKATAVGAEAPTRAFYSVTFDSISGWSA